MTIGGPIPATSRTRPSDPRPSCPQGGRPSGRSTSHSRRVAGGLVTRRGEPPATSSAHLLASVEDERTDDDRQEAAGHPERDLEVGEIPRPAAADADEVGDSSPPEQRRDPVAEHAGDEQPAARPQAPLAAEPAERREPGQEPRHDDRRDRHRQAQRQLAGAVVEDDDVCVRDRPLLRQQVGREGGGEDGEPDPERRHRLRVGELQRERATRVRATATYPAIATPTATSAIQTVRNLISRPAGIRASGSRITAPAVTIAPSHARRVRHCCPNQPNSGPVSTPPTSTRASLCRKPTAVVDVSWAFSSGLSVITPYAAKAQAVQPNPSSAARRAPLCVQPATNASTSHGAESRLTSAAHGTQDMLPRYWSPAPNSAARASTSRTPTGGAYPAELTP